ncbi:RNHCP domain-containing protein, partial [Streptomyces sp. SID7499]|nr:RNHCP domain-containing protein [Streptomyces sp. SID7499]
SSPAHVDDNQLMLMQLAVRPLAQPPFPLEAFGDL